MSKYTNEEIAEAREALELYPSNSPFWDSRHAQGILEIIQELDLVPATFR